MTQYHRPFAPSVSDSWVTDRPPNVRDLLKRVAKHLEDGQADLALAAVESSRIASPWLENARGVCLMRLNRNRSAVEVLRGLIFDPAGFAIRPDSDPVHQANYATALLLDGNTDGFFSIVSSIRERNHPAVARQYEAIRRWKAGMTWGQRLWSLIGSPARPLTLEFPPGEL